MKSRRIGFVPVLMLVALTVAFSPMIGCGFFGNQARNASVQTLNLSLSGVSEDAHAGLATLQPEQRPDALLALTTFEDAVKSKDRERIVAEAAPVWTTVRALAAAGIEADLAAKKIGPNGADLLRERLKQMDGTFQRLTLPPR